MEIRIRSHDVPQLRYDADSNAMVRHVETHWHWLVTDSGQTVQGQGNSAAHCWEQINKLEYPKLGRIIDHDETIVRNDPTMPMGPNGNVRID